MKLTPIIALILILSACKLCSFGEKMSGNSNSDGDFAEDSISECTAGDAEDIEWCKRLKIARMKSQPEHVAAGEIPSDPNLKKIYDDPVVFTELQGYVWMSSQTVAIEGYGDQFRNTQKYYFMPTGRFYYKSTMYYGQTTPDGNVTEIWGRYRFTKPDEIEVESDAGEKQTMAVKYGRRNLIFGDTTYGEVNWENEALRRQLNQ